MNNLDKTLTLTEIKKRVKSSFINLTVRQIILRSISFLSLNIILAKVLPVEMLGIFNIANTVILFIAYFSDIGLAASLIQKKEDVTEDDIKTVFTIQQIIVVILTLSVIIFAPWIGNFYSLDIAGVWLIRILAISFFLSSLKVVPSVILERNLLFQPLVLVEVAETLVFNILLVLLVFQNYGIWAFSLAAISRGLVGTGLIYLIAPVKVRLAISMQAAKSLLHFGIPYQINSLLALLKDRLTALVIATMVGPLGVGYITWSQSLALLPLEVMNIVNRITFPAYSRLQDNKEALGRAVEKSLFVTAMLTFPALVGLGAILPSLVEYVVSTKWLPAVPSFYLFAVNTFWAVISTIFINTLNAVGKIKTTLKIMVFWTVATWILSPTLVYFYGFIGVAMSTFIISFTSIIVIILVKRMIKVDIIKSITLPIIASILMGLFVFLIARSLVTDYLTLGITVGLGGLIYLGLIFLLGKKKIFAELESIKNVATA